MRVLLPDGALGGADPILEILNKYKSIAVVGLSSNPTRPSYGVTEYMQSAGYRIIPVNPNEMEVLGEEELRAAGDVPEKSRIVEYFPEAGGSGGGGGKRDSRGCKGRLDATGSGE